MTRYKRYLKEKNYKFNEDYPFLPIDSYGATLEDADVFVCKYGLMVVKVFTSIISRTFITGDRSNFFVEVYDEYDDVESELLNTCDIVIPNDDDYMYMFNEKGELKAVLTPSNKTALFVKASLEDLS